ncbi:MAG: CpsD/CapB family tyrosine-protein kinase [Wujia sp.]|nr:CpsD/CapB family tyrosine-protein kinase [Wujia sp.]MDD7283689.1 CpsD/CapB family tyrosine-protein kinase [Clostridium sp.]MDY3728375.1 CpsD/CapB family tyrosine-protein kinase [Wujia sp.]
MKTVVLRNLTKFSYAMKESLRTLRTNIQFCGDDMKVIMFTSSIPNEGKSTVTVNLARSLSESGKSVLVVDTDMRKSVLMGRLKAKATEDKQVNGLSHYLSGQKALPDVVYLTQMPRFCMIFAGPSVPNPTEILDKKYFEDLITFARKNFDYVLIDCAPIGAAIDAAVVAKYCDGAVLVMAQGASDRRMVLEAKKQLEVAGVKLLGAVLNKVKAEKGYYGKYYGSHYGHYYGSYYGNYGDEG